MYEFDGEYFYVGSMEMEKTRKYLDLIENLQVIVIDDVVSEELWQPRRVKVDGSAGSKQ